MSRIRRASTSARSGRACGCGREPRPCLIARALGARTMSQLLEGYEPLGGTDGQTSNLPRLVRETGELIQALTLIARQLALARLGQGREPMASPLEAYRRSQLERCGLSALPGTERTLRGAAIQIAAAEMTQQPIASRNPSR